MSSSRQNNIPGSNEALDVIVVNHSGDLGGIFRAAVLARVVNAQVFVVCKVKLGGEHGANWSIVAVDRGDSEVNVRRSVSTIIVSSGKNGLQVVRSVFTGIEAYTAAIIWRLRGDIAVYAIVIRRPGVDKCFYRRTFTSLSIGQPSNGSIQEQSVVSWAVEAHVGCVWGNGLERGVGFVVGTENVFCGWLAWSRSRKVLQRGSCLG